MSNTIDAAVRQLAHAFTLDPTPEAARAIFEMMGQGIEQHAVAVLLLRDDAAALDLAQHFATGFGMSLSSTFGSEFAELRAHIHSNAALSRAHDALLAHAARWNRGGMTDQERRACAWTMVALMVEVFGPFYRAVGTHPDAVRVLLKLFRELLDAPPARAAMVN